MKSGYLYVLTHPSDPKLFKIGVTILAPEKRLDQHNQNYSEYAGQIVKETGKRWELKTYITVEDPYWAEKAFWRATPIADLPFLGGIEVHQMEWEWVQCGLDAAMKAGVRPDSAKKKPTVQTFEWLQDQLQGTGITLMESYRGSMKPHEFQCENGHVFEENPRNVARRKCCPCCVSWSWHVDSLRESLK